MRTRLGMENWLDGFEFTAIVQSTIHAGGKPDIFPVQKFLRGRHTNGSLCILRIRNREPNSAPIVEERLVLLLLTETRR